MRFVRWPRAILAWTGSEGARRRTRGIRRVILMHGGAAGRRRHSIARAASGAIDSFDLTSTHSAMASSVLKRGSLWVCMHCLCLPGRRN
jgi:hypothetical protein